MTAKKFNIYRIVIAIILSAVFSISLTLNNYIVPVVTVITAIILIQMLRKNVKEVMVDERIYEVAGKASRLAITIFTIMLSIIVFFLFAFRAKNPYFETIGSVLAYSVCCLMILYNLIYKYLVSDNFLKKNKIYFFIVVFFLVFLAVVFNLRLFSGEDDWICSNGQWVKHGNPDFPAPMSQCK